jgi:PAS domain S-box-containing protein
MRLRLNDLVRSAMLKRRKRQERRRVADAFTKHKRTEDELRQAQARIESVLASVADTHILFDRQWRYTYVNEAAVRTLGRPREQVLGHTLWELHPDIVGTELDAQYHRAMDEQIPVSNEFYYPFTDSWWENRLYPVSEGLSVFATNITGLKKAGEAVQLYSKELEEMKTALKVLLKQWEQDQKSIKEKVHVDVKQLVLPYIEKLKKRKSGADAAYLSIIETNLQRVISSLETRTLGELHRLTPQELLVANLIKDGRQDKDISEILNLSIHTIKAHRRNIRKKFGLTNGKANLRTFLSSL